MGQGHRSQPPNPLPLNCPVPEGRLSLFQEFLASPHTTTLPALRLWANCRVMALPPTRCTGNRLCGRQAAICSPFIKAKASKKDCSGSEITKPRSPLPLKISHLVSSSKAGGCEAARLTVTSLCTKGQKALGGGGWQTHHPAHLPFILFFLCSSGSSRHDHDTTEQDRDSWGHTGCSTGQDQTGLLHGCHPGAFPPATDQHTRGEA